jgi:hypothetical protein
VDGKFLDAPFSLSFWQQSSFVGRTDRRYGSYQSTANSAETVRMAPGYYWMRMPGIGRASGQVVASAVGDSDAYCHIEGWYDSSTDMIATIICWSAWAHAPVDTEFSVGVSW